ncbi:MAG: hypothetical protein JNM10_19990 [Planctomycetia bacterium]|nr:hypothetical protein [Planctomycetia bacterium]
MTRWDPQQKALHRAIGEVLHYRWDPLGVADDPAARTEYEAYAAQVFSKLAAGASVEAIAAYLTGVTVEAMGLAPAPDHDALVARLVLAWRDELATRGVPEASPVSSPALAPVPAIAAADGEPRRPGLTLTRGWSDEGMLEFRIEGCDGTSSFVNEVCVGLADLEAAVEALRTFQGGMQGGPHDLAFGGFGPTWAGGAFRARLQVMAGRLLLSCEQESSFEPFGDQPVASRATLFFRSEPALLDRFVRELAAVASGHRQTAFLEGV